MHRWPVTALAWCAALGLAVWLLAVLDFRTRDPDSALHTRLVAELTRRPVVEWMAPRWPPGWYMTGLYREHPAGIVLLPAALARLGYPAEQAAYGVNALYQVLSLIAIQRVALSFVNGLEARTLGWAIQLLPIAFTYRIRANHEQAVLLCLLGALWATERSRSRPAWAAVTAAAFVAMALIKGLFALLGPAACAFWLLTRPPRPATRARTWLALLGAAAAIPLGAVAYEAAYRSVTGEPFLAVYLGHQLGVSAQAHSESLLAQKAYNLAWYLGRLLWFAFPWSVAAVAAAWIQRPGAASARREANETAGAAASARQGLAFTLGLSLLYLLLFSLSDRKADRYLFPAYYALGASGVVAVVRGWSGFRRLAAATDRLGHLAPVLVWIAAFALHVAAGRLNLPRIKLWPSD